MTIEDLDIGQNDYISIVISVDADAENAGGINLFGEHFDNCYVRHGDWKAVKDEKSKEWELFNIPTDRTERRNLAARYPEFLDELVAKWKAWADTHEVYPKRLQK